MSTGTTTDYASNFVYENNTLQFFNQPEGYVEPNGGTGFNYVYQYKDHLGNIRLSYKDISTTSTPILQIQEENNYYPFGLKHKGYNNVQTGRDHKFGFNGKEEQDDNLGGSQLNWLDFGARNYDGAIGRFFNMDRFSEKYYSLNPYQYGANNPIIFNDIKGDSILIYSKKDKANILYQDGNLYSKNSTTGKFETYNGKNVKVDKNGNKTIGGFLGKSARALDKIRGGKAGNELVSDLQNSTKHIRIGEGKNEAEGLSGRVSWNDSNSDAAGNSRPSFIGLAHELGHAHDGLDGVLNGINIIIGNIGGKDISAAEFTSMHWENRVRGENSLSLRAFYGKDDRGNIVGQNLNINGYSLYFSQQQIVPSMHRQSQFKDGRIQIITVPGTTATTIPFRY